MTLEELHSRAEGLAGYHANAEAIVKLVIDYGNACRAEAGVNRADMAVAAEKLLTNIYAFHTNLTAMKAVIDGQQLAVEKLAFVSRTIERMLTSLPDFEGAVQVAVSVLSPP